MCYFVNGTANRLDHPSGNWHSMSKYSNQRFCTWAQVLRINLKCENFENAKYLDVWVFDSRADSKYIVIGARNCGIRNNMSKNISMTFDSLVFLTCRRILTPFFNCDLSFRTLKSFCVISIVFAAKSWKNVEFSTKWWSRQSTTTVRTKFWTKSTTATGSKTTRNARVYCRHFYLKTKSFLNSFHWFLLIFVPNIYWVHAELQIFTRGNARY